MRIQFGGSYTPPPVVTPEGEWQVFEFLPISLLENDYEEASVVVESFGDGTIGWIVLGVYLTAVELSDMSMTLIHPLFSPESYGSGMIGYHVVMNFADNLPAGISDIGESEEQLVYFVWRNDVPSIRDYTQDAFGNFCPNDDFSVLYGLPMAGEWKISLSDADGAKDDLLQIARLWIYDGNSVPVPPQPSTPVPHLELSLDGLDLTMDASGSTGGVAPLEYFWEIYTGDDDLVDSVNDGFPSLDPIANYTLPSSGDYLITLRVNSDTNFAKEYLVQPITA